VTDWLWLNAPERWERTENGLRFTTSPQVDFWRHTLVDSVSDNGHLYYTLLDGDFAVRTLFGGDYHDQYDQAGIVVRQDQENYLKVGIEFVKGSWDDRYTYEGDARLPNASLTRHGWSEWSVSPQLSKEPEAVWLDVRREGSTIFAAFSLDGKHFTPIKMLALPEATTLMVGPYATSPSGNGFDVWFDNLIVETT
jgi:hypothetical protein